MKKRLFIFSLLLCIFLSACGKASVDNPGKTTDTPSQVTDKSDTPSQVTDKSDTPSQVTDKSDTPSQVTDKSDTQINDEYVVKYEEVLGKTYKFIKNIATEACPHDEMMGIWEAAKAMRNDALSIISYTFKDLNGDDVSELLIGAFDKTDEAFTNNEIYAIYTLKNDKPEFLLEGRSRSMYSLKDDGTFFYMGSNGAAYSIFGIYNISDDNEIVCKDYYFTYPDEKDSAKIEVYYNKTGIYYCQEAEKLDMTLDEFWEKQEEASKGTVKLSATPFAKLDAEIIKKALEEAPAPEPEMFLGGEWVLSSVEVDGSELTAEEAGIESEISIDIPSFTAKYFSKTEYTNQWFDAELELLEEPIYKGCGNDEWSVRLKILKSNLGEDEEFYATLINEKTLLLQHLYPFDGTQGVSYQYYTHK